MLGTLIPGKSKEGLMTDGAILWQLCLHVFKGHPHPMQQAVLPSVTFSPDTSLADRMDFRPAGFSCGLEILNDDKTPMELVVSALMKHLEIEREAAIALMLDIHGKGGLLIPLPDMEKAKIAAAGIVADAYEAGYPLVCRAVGPEPIVEAVE